MKHTEKEILKIATKVMDDIGWAYDKNKPMSVTSVSKEELLERWKNLQGFEGAKDRITGEWTVGMLYEPEEDGFQDSLRIFLVINDETGEPREIGHRQSSFRFTGSADKGWSLQKTF